MILFFLVSIFSVKICKVSITPIIDGNIDSVYYKGTPISTFIQWNPKEGAVPTESTKVYINYDDKGFYIAFQCFDSEPEKLDIRVCPRDRWDGDQVWVILDTFGDKATAYEFGVNAAGVQSDGRVREDGRYTDYSWDGVRYSAAKITDYGYNVEMQIPFKTLRYNPGINEWGINFFRYIARKDECVSWAPLKQAEGIRVSRCGILKGINPGKQGLHLEIYPVALTQYESKSIYPKAGLDLSWALTSSQFSLTTYPDFAQIEADPYTINLSKYETYFEERRPFFTEGQEIFDTPIKLFYSRRVGKRIWTDEDVEEIPIICGAKYTGTLGRLNFGFLSAYTEKLEDESNTLYSVGRLKLGLLKNSEMGLIYSEARDKIDKQAVAGVDATFRTTELQVQSQFAHSDNWNAGIADFRWYARKFILKANYEKYGESFSISQIGYSPWEGVTRYSFYSGPQWFNKGVFRKLTTGCNLGMREEVGEAENGYWAGVWGSSNFNNNWGSYISFIMGKDYELTEYYDYYKIQSMLWTDYSKPVVLDANLSSTSYGFNYRRNYFAPSAQNDLSVEWRVSPPLSLLLDISNTVEWKPDGNLEALSWVFRPILQYAITKDMHIRIYTEPNTDTHIHQFNVLFSYNFKPKSWFYIALNETRDNAEGKMSHSDRIAVVKLRYLFFL